MTAFTRFLGFLNYIGAGLFYGALIAIGIALLRYGLCAASGGTDRENGRAALMAGIALLVAASTIFWYYPWHVYAFIDSVVTHWHRKHLRELIGLSLSAVSIAGSVWLGLRTYSRAFAEGQAHGPKRFDGRVGHDRRSRDRSLGPGLGRINRETTR